MATPTLTQQQNRQQMGYILLVGLLVAFPLPALVALLLLGFRKIFKSRKTAFNIVLGLLTLSTFVLFFTSPRIVYYVSSVPLFQAGISRGLDGIFRFLRQLASSPRIVRACLWAGAPVAWGLLGALAMMDDQLKIPKTVKTPTPKLQADPTQEGALLGELGRQGSGRYCRLSPAELNKHIALVGTTGSGKTTTLYNFVQYGLEKEQAVIIIDGKGDFSLSTRLEAMAWERKRPFFLFSMTDPPTLDTFTYNPFTVGDATELTDKLMTLSDWSEEHYKLSAQRFLQLLFRAFELKGISPDLATITRYTNRKQLLELLTETPAAPRQPGPKQKSIIGSSLDLDDLTEGLPLSNENKELIDSLESIDAKAVSGLSSRLGILAEGSLRDMFKINPKNTLDLFTAIEKKALVLFSLDSLVYPEQARLLGRLIVADIKAQISYHGRHRAGQPVLLIFDEFNVFASGTVVDLVNKSRAAGFEAVLAFQSLADIDRLEHGEQIRRQIIQNCNTLIVHRQNDPSDAEELARAIGTRDSIIITQQISTDGSTGLGSMRPEKAFKVHPDQIKELRVGEAFVKRHTDKGMTVNKVFIRQI